MFQRLVKWSDRHRLMMESIGLVQARKQAFRNDVDLFNLLQKKEGELKIRFDGLMKTAADVLSSEAAAAAAVSADAGPALAAAGAAESNESMEAGGGHEDAEEE